MVTESEENETAAPRREKVPDAEVPSTGENAGAWAVARVFPVVMSVAALGPTLLAMGVSFVIALKFPERPDLPLLISALVSARGQNAVARWMMLGPGVPKTRWLLGAALLSADWLAFSVFLRMTMQSHMVAELAFFFGVMKIAFAALALGAWGCVFLASERDRIPGVAFHERGYGLRHLLIALAGFGLLLAGARTLFTGVPDLNDGFLVVIFVFFAVEVAGWSVATFLIDLATRLVVLSRNSDRRFIGAALFGALALLTLAAFGVAESNGGGAYVAKFLLLPAGFYLALSVSLEVVLRLLGVRAVSQFEPRDDADRPARRLDEPESQAFASSGETADKETK